MLKDLVVVLNKLSLFAKKDSRFERAAAAGSRRAAGDAEWDDGDDDVVVDANPVAWHLFAFFHLLSSQRPDAPCPPAASSSSPLSWTCCHSR